jgi:HK97 family phage portal protein
VSLFARRTERRVISYQQYFGSGAPSPLTGSLQERALRLAPVFGAVRLLGDNISTTPFVGYRVASDDSSIRLPVQPALLTTPTQHGSVIDWRMRMVTSMALRGNAFGLPTGYDSNARVTQLEWLDPDCVTLERDDVMFPPRWYVLGRPVEHLVHIPWFVLPGRVLGLSPIRAFKTLIETGIKAEQFGHDWFTNGAVPSGVLESDQVVNKETAEVLKHRFKEAARGRDIVALGVGAKYKPITVPPEESQFLETIKATATQIATIFGVPPERIGGEAGGPLTYTTVAMNGEDLLRFTLRTYLRRIEAVLSALLPRPQVVRADADELTRPDALTRYQGYQIAVSTGVLSRNEVRHAEALPPIDGGDTYADPTATPLPAPVQPAQEGGGNVQQP